MMFRTRALPAIVALAALAGCAREGELVVNQGVGITSVLTSCPADVYSMPRPNLPNSDRYRVVSKSRK